MAWSGPPISLTSVSDGRKFFEKIFGIGSFSYVFGRLICFTVTKLGMYEMNCQKYSQKQDFLWNSDVNM